MTSKEQSLASKMKDIATQAKRVWLDQEFDRLSNALLRGVEDAASKGKFNLLTSHPSLVDHDLRQALSAKFKALGFRVVSGVSYGECFIELAWS
jgi:anaerobic glycerol-3-phosphate dehydrogenase